MFSWFSFFHVDSLKLLEMIPITHFGFQLLLDRVENFFHIQPNAWGLFDHFPCSTSELLKFYFKNLKIS